MKIQKHIQVVRSGTPSLSSMGEKSRDMIVSLLRDHYETVGITTVNDIFDLAILAAKQPDLVVLGMKQIPNNDPKVTSPIWLADYLDSMHLNYTGSPATAIGLDYDKTAAKKTVRRAGLKTSDSFEASVGQFSTEASLPLSFPLFVKPPHTGGGKGIAADSVVRDFDSFTHKVQTIADEFGTVSLVETYLSGREFSVAIFGTPGVDKLLAMPIELITDANADGDRILGQTVKAEDTEHVVLVTDPALKTRINRLAKAAYTALGARDYGRIDIRLDARGVPHFLEANLIPGLAKNDFTSYFTAACELNENMDYETMILRLVSLGLDRPPLQTPKADTTVGLTV